MMLRFIHAWITHNLRALGNFKLIGTQEQSDAALALYDLFIKTKGSPELNDFYPLQHRLCDTLLRAKNLSEDPVGCPTDQMIFITALLGPNRYRPASSITAVCAQLQFCFRSILIHVVRLDAEEVDQYTPFSLSQAATGGALEPLQDASSGGSDLSCTTNLPPQYCDGGIGGFVHGPELDSNDDHDDHEQSDDDHPESDCDWEGEEIMMSGAHIDYTLPLCTEAHLYTRSHFRLHAKVSN
jgi:hypothetical protein